MEHREDIVALTDACVGCGKCRAVCPSYNRGGCDPMAVMKGDTSEVKGCIGCGGCSEACAHTDPWKVMMYMNCTVNGMTVPTVFRETGYHIPGSDREGIPDADYSEEGDICLAPGCLVNGALPFLENAGVSALRAVGYRVSRLDTGCCTFPIPYRSMTDGERDSVKRKGTVGADGRRVVTLCPGCSREFRSSGIDAVHIVEVLHSHLDLIRELERVDMTVCIQPGCHLSNLTVKFREVAEATGARVIDVPIGCCGKTVPGISDIIMDERQKDMEDADAVVVGCPSCFMRYDSREGGLKVMHISELVSAAAGGDGTLRFHRDRSFYRDGHVPLDTHVTGDLDRFDDCTGNGTCSMGECVIGQPIDL